MNFCVNLIDFCVNLHGVVPRSVVSPCLAGICRDLGQKGATPSAYEAMGQVLHTMHRRYAENLQVADLAAAASLSTGTGTHPKARAEHLPTRS